MWTAGQERQRPSDGRTAGPAMAASEGGGRGSGVEHKRAASNSRKQTRVLPRSFGRNAALPPFRFQPPETHFRTAIPQTLRR